MKMTYSRSETIELANNEIITLQLQVEDSTNQRSSETPDQCYARLANFVNERIRSDLSINLKKTIQSYIDDLLAIDPQYTLPLYRLFVQYNARTVDGIDLDDLKPFLNDLKRLS